MDFYFENMKNDTNIIWISIENMLDFKIKGMLPKDWACCTHLNLWIEMNMAGLIFKPRRPNFQNHTMLYDGAFLFRSQKKLYQKHAALAKLKSKHLLYWYLHFFDIVF